MNRVLRSGELVLLIDRKKRHYLTRLETNGEFHTHAGAVAHDLIIGSPEGSQFFTAKGVRYQVMRPTLSDYVLKMPRAAQVIYPKDLGPILILGDIYPGAKVFESGVGSGALSMTMLRAGANITGYELRDDFAQRAIKNVSDFLGEEALERYDVQIRSAYDGIDGDDFDRVILDLPEPWNVVPHAADALVAGGIILAYTPSIIQATKFKAELLKYGFSMFETVEFMRRTWHVEPSQDAVRPDHRMVAHTGFLTTARKLATSPANSGEEE